MTTYPPIALEWAASYEKQGLSPCLAARQALRDCVKAGLICTVLDGMAMQLSNALHAQK